MKQHCKTQLYLRIIIFCILSWSFLPLVCEGKGKERPFSHFIHKKKDKKTIAAVLAFPFIGCTGAHRIYLGTQPLVPVTYTATLGGCLGILPLADMLAILISKDIEEYSNNPRVFMWIK